MHLSFLPWCLGCAGSLSAWRLRAVAEDCAACLPHLAVLRMCAGEGKDIELRHQRNPDVLFDCVQQQGGALDMHHPCKAVQC